MFVTMIIINSVECVFHFLAHAPLIVFMQLVSAAPFEAHLSFILCVHPVKYTAFDSEIAFAILLGPTDPCSIAVSMEPFSTLALKGLT